MHLTDLAPFYPTPANSSSTYPNTDCLAASASLQRTTEGWFLDRKMLVFDVCSIGIFAPYYEPTIVVHDDSY